MQGDRSLDLMELVRGMFDDEKEDKTTHACIYSDGTVTISFVNQDFGSVQSLLCFHNLAIQTTTYM